MKKLVLQGLAAAILGAAALAVTTGSASAYVVCNNNGACWHTHDRYTYPPQAGVVIHPNNWRWRDRDRDRYHWREHDGRGYWRNGIWLQF